MAPSPSPKPRWRRRSEARPEEILEAALQEFTESGFDAARVEDIAKRAGLSKAAVYLYFPSKAALLEALIEARVAPLARQAEAIAQLGADDPLSALRLIARTAAHHLKDPSVFAVPRLILALSPRFSGIVDYYRTNVAHRAKGAIEGLLHAAMRQGAIRDIDVSAVARAFIGAFVFEAMWLHVLRGESAFGDPEALVAHHFDILINGLEPRV